jgi:uncharacterized membrane protein YeaQ/YmgE (transglycosylase-associated protein family)
VLNSKASPHHAKIRRRMAFFGALIGAIIVLVIYHLIARKTT